MMVNRRVALGKDGPVSAIKQSLLASIEQLDDEEARQALEFIRQLRKKEHLQSLREWLANDSTFTLPPQLGEPFTEIDPLATPGESASQMLVADRR
jgi:hypothetical protein